MKSIFVFILLIAIVSTASNEEDDDEFGPEVQVLEYFNDYYAEKDRRGQAYGRPVPDAAERECVKQKIKLSVNGEKKAKAYIANMMIQLSTIACSKGTEEDIRKSFNMSIEEFSAIEDDTATKISCIRRKIQELNGAEKVVNEKCKAVDEITDVLVRKLEDENDRIKSLGVQDCVNLNVNGLNSELLEAIVKRFENSETDDAFINARASFAKNMLNLITKIAECLVGTL